MAGRRVYGGSDMAALLQNEGISAGAFEALISSTSSRSGFNGSRSMLNFEEVCGNSINQNFYRPREMEEMGDDDFDECLHQPEKKRRLTTEQVQFLEKSFEVENKLEPERKIQLAKDLGLQPRQVAIWFQNRRARWKTKQLERDYDVLKSSFNVLKSDYDNLLKEKDKLKAEVVHLTDKLLLREKLKDTEEDLKVKQSENNPTTEEQNSESRVTEVKLEDHSSTNSAIFDSESPHYTDGARTDSARTDSSNAVEPGQSDISYIEDEGEVKGYRHFLKLEDSSPSFDFPVEDQTFWFWP